MLILGLEKDRTTNQLFYHKEQFLYTIVHGDDFLSVGSSKDLDALDKVLKQHLKLKILPRIGPGASDKGIYLHREIRWSQKGFTYEADPKHVEIIIKELGFENNTKGLTTPLQKVTSKTSDALDLLDPQEASNFRSIAGRLLYLSADRLDIQYALSLIHI